MSTSCTVAFGRNNIEIKDDAAITILFGGLKSIGDLEALRLGYVPSKPYATFESNFWLLDGEYKIAPATNPRGGWISTAVSGSTGNFDFASEEPEIQIDFDTVHSTNGLTLYFGSHSGDYADSVRVEYYDAAIALIRDDTYSPTSAIFSTNQSIANFKRLLISIHSTNRASRYARLQAIDFDGLTRFTGTDIKAARVVQEINPLSTELTIDTLDLTLFSSSGDFSIVAPSGFYSSLQYKEPLDVYEDVNGDTVYVGRFYLDEWESLSANVAEFKASDAIGLLNKDYLPQIFPSSPFGLLDPISDSWTVDGFFLVEDIFRQAGNIGWDTTGVSYPDIKGWLPITSCREALQQVLFRIGAYATCARSNIIQIRPFELAASLTTYDHTLTQAQKGINSPLQLRQLVTAVEVVSHNYISDGKALAEIINFTTVVPETFIVKFDFPIRDVSSVVGATVLRYGSTWYELEDTNPGAVSFTARGYNDTKKIERINAIVPANTPPFVVSITDATVIEVGGVTAVTQRVYDYYAQRYLQKTRLFASIIAPGDSVLVDVQSSKQMKGIVERMEIDLAGGFVSNVDIIGVIA